LPNLQAEVGSMHWGESLKADSVKGDAEFEKLPDKREQGQQKLTLQSP
jgi:hypothetical protein